MNRHFPRLFVWHAVRNALRHRLLGLLNVLTVALGVAVYLAIQIANDSATRSFAAGVDLAAGKSHLEIRGAIPETLWPVVAQQPGIASVTGLVDGVVTLPDYPGEYLRVLGMDLFTSEPFRTFQLTTTGVSLDLESWLGRGDGIAVSAEFAQRTGLKAGDQLRALVNAEMKTLTVRSLLDPGDSPLASMSRFAVMDIGWAQELFGKVGRLSALQILVFDPRQTSTVAGSLRKILPADLRAEAPRQRSFQMQTMLAAFQLNLTALSMVSLLVGVFLIYNTVSASVARQRVEIGILRSLGATRTEIRALFLGEAAILGTLGIAFGAVGGVALARVLTGAVAQTISSLYLLLSIERNALHPTQFVAAAAFGFAAVLIGAWLPACEAARADPIAVLSRGAHIEQSAMPLRGWSWLALASLIGAASLAYFALHGGPPASSFGAAFLVLESFAVLAPSATRLFARLAARLTGPGVLWRMAADHLQRSLPRNAVTVAALGAAVAMMVGLTVMIFSFRESVNAWIERGIVADLFIAPASNEIVGLEASVASEPIAWLRARPEVAGVDTFRERTVMVRQRRGDEAPALLAVLHGEYRHNLTFVGGEDVEKMRRVFADGAVAISEPLARKFQLAEGARVTLLTPHGPAEFSIVGVYSDYTRDQGVLLMAHSTFARFWEDEAVQSLAVYLQPNASAEPLAEAFRERFSRAGEFVVYPNRSLRERIFRIFDQTFAITYVLRTVAIIVAIAGISLSIVTLVVEREREIGVLRAIGASAGQVQRLFVAEAGMIALISSALGLAAGLVLAMVLTWVVNPAFFGWTIHLQLPWSALASTPLWILAAALLAAWFPAQRAGQIPIAQSVREE